MTFVTEMGEKICGLLTETSRDGWSSRVGEGLHGLAEGGAEGEDGSLEGPGGEGGGARGGRSKRRWQIPIDDLSQLPDDNKAPRLVFGNDVVDSCGRDDQLPSVIYTMVNLLHGDALRAHHIFQDDVRSLT